MIDAFDGFTSFCVVAGQTQGGGEALSEQKATIKIVGTYKFAKSCEL